MIIQLTHARARARRLRAQQTGRRRQAKRAGKLAPIYGLLVVTCLSAAIWAAIGLLVWRLVG